MSSFHQHAGPITADLIELISFEVKDQTFCIDSKSVREIRGWTQATPLPQSPDFIRGVINLRGTVLPILDLAARLGFQPTDPTARHAIIVVSVDDQSIGLLVDGVEEILTVERSRVQPTPDVSRGPQELVSGLLPVGSRMLALLSLRAIVPAEVSSAAA